MGNLERGPSGGNRNPETVNQNEKATRVRRPFAHLEQPNLERQESHRVYQGTYDAEGGAYIRTGPGSIARLRSSEREAGLAEGLGLEVKVFSKVPSRKNSSIEQEVEYFVSEDSEETDIFNVKRFDVGEAKTERDFHKVFSEHSLPTVADYSEALSEDYSEVSLEDEPERQEIELPIVRTVIDTPDLEEESSPQVELLPKQGSMQLGARPLETEELPDSTTEHSPEEEPIKLVDRSFEAEELPDSAAEYDDNDLEEEAVEKKLGTLSLKARGWQERLKGTSRKNKIAGLASVTVVLAGGVGFGANAWSAEDTESEMYIANSTLQQDLDAIEEQVAAEQEIREPVDGANVLLSVDIPTGDGDSMNLKELYRQSFYEEVDDDGEIIPVEDDDELMSLAYEGYADFDETNPPGTFTISESEVTVGQDNTDAFSINGSGDLVYDMAEVDMYTSVALGEDAEVDYSAFQANEELIQDNPEELEEFNTAMSEQAQLAEAYAAQGVTDKVSAEADLAEQASAVYAPEETKAIIEEYLDDNHPEFPGEVIVEGDVEVQIGNQEIQDYIDDNSSSVINGVAITQVTRQDASEDTE